MTESGRFYEYGRWMVEIGFYGFTFSMRKALYPIVHHFKQNTLASGLGARDVELAQFLHHIKCHF